MAMPVFKAAGTAVASLNSAGIGWPIGHAAGDFGLFFIETCGGEPVPATPSGWTPVANSPQATGAGTAGTQLTVFYKVATSSSEPSAPTGDSGDHNHGVIVTFTGLASIGSPWDVTAGGVKATAAANASLPTLTTTVADTLIVQAITHDLDIGTPAFTSVTNAALASLTERHDQSSGQGNGGGIAVFTGQKAVAGSIGTTTVNVASCVNAMLTIALRGPLLVPNVVGLAEATASSTITGAGLTVGTITYGSSPTVPTGDVISQSPTAGTEAAGGSAVDFVVSTGPSTIAVPDVVGEAEADAITAITAAGLTVGTITTAPSASVPAGHVISQSPTAGTMVTPGSAVDLVIAVAAGLVIRINGVEWKFRAGSMSINSTLNGRDTLSGVIDMLDDADPPTLNQEIVVEEDGVRIFGGKISELEYRAITSDPDASIDLMVTVSAGDFNALADNRTVASFVYPAGLTLKEALELFVAELTASGVTLSTAQLDGPVLPALNFSLISATAVLDELAKMTAYVWEIDYSKALLMWQPGTIAAPFNITDGDHKVWGDIVITPLASDYANRIIHRSGPPAPEAFNDWWYTDGVTNAFYYHENVLWPHDMCLVDTPLETPGNPYGGFETVGAPGEGKQWEFHDGPFGSQYLSRTAGPPPAGGAYAIPVPLQHKCFVQFPLVVTADDLPGQAANGIIEKVIDHGPEILFRETAQAIADSYLTRHVSEKNIIRFSTRETGLRVGQSITITIARRNIDGPYFITDVETRMVGATILKRSVTANKTELFQGSWRDTYKLWAANSGGGSSGGASGSSGGGEYPPPGTAMPHHATHEPGGIDPLTVDSTAAIGSLRTLGTGVNQAAAGNDARLSNPRVPTAHKTTHEPGGSDALAVDSAAAVGSLRTLGTGSTQAAPGNALADYLLRADVDQVIQIGTRAVQPAATAVLAGTLYCVTDDRYEVERSTGTVWETFVRRRHVAIFAYDYSSTTTAPPATTTVRFNGAAPYTAVTKIWLHTQTNDGRDVYLGLVGTDTGARVTIQDKNDHTIFATFTLTGAPVDNTTYIEWPVVYHSNGGATLLNNQAVLVMKQ